MSMHEAAVEPAGHVLRIVRWPTGVRRDDPDHAQALVQVTLVRFTVVPGVGEQRAERVTRHRFACRPTQVRLVGPRSASAPTRERQVTAHLDHFRELRKTPVFPADSVLVVLRDVT
jgi:hypothetical protein